MMTRAGDDREKNSEGSFKKKIAKNNNISATLAANDMVNDDQPSHRDSELTGTQGPNRNGTQQRELRSTFTTTGGIA
jgi:hypothetical protein